MSTQDEKIGQLEKDILGVKYILNSQETILKEIKDVLVAQSKTLENMHAIRQNIKQVEGDVDELKKTFETRKEVTDKNNDQFKEFVSATKGGLRVGLVCLAIIQGLLSWIAVENYTQQKETTTVVSKIKEDIAVMKHNISK